MVLSVIFGEEPEEAPPPPPPPPPPTKGELFKAAVKRRASNIKETYEYQKKKRETKKLFKGVGKGSGSSSGVSSFSSASASDYEHDKFEVLPTKDQEPQVREQGYQPNDIDYWNGGNMPHYPNNYPPDNRSTFSKKTATFKDKTTSRGNTITHDNQGKPATINNQYRQLGESRQGTLRNESLIRREEIRQVGQSSRDPSDWEYLDSKPGNLQNRTLRKSGGTATRPKEDRGRYHEAPDSDGAMYDDRISLQTNKIHFAARTNTEQRRVLEQEERERARNTARQRRKTLAEDVIAGAAKCSQAVVGLFNRMKITVLYMCGFCSNTV